MGILKDKAEALRLLAAKLEQLGSDVPAKAKEIVHQFAPKGSVLRCQQRIDLERARDPEFVRHTIKATAHSLADDIVNILGFAYKGMQKEPQANSMYIPSHFLRDQAVYEAEVVVLTRRQLEEIIERALEAKEIQAPTISLHCVSPRKPQFGDKLRFCHGGALRTVVRGDGDSPVKLHDSSGRDANCFLSFDELAEKIGPDKMYTYA